MAQNNYYDPKDLRKFGNITEWSNDLGTKFFEYYGSVFEEGALTAREKVAFPGPIKIRCLCSVDAV